jgi:O-antigen/teichoic acid export membrane protein
MITIISFYAVIFDLVKSVFLLFRSSINVLFDRDNFKKLYGFGYLFFLFGLTLNASVFIDQLIVTTYLDAKISANYIAHITLFMSPLLFLNKFMTSFAAPYLRDDHKGIVSRIRKKLPLVIWGFVLLMILCYVASYVGFKVFYAKKYELVLSLTFFIWFTGILRILYIFPSAIVGMRGIKSELHSFLTGNVVGLLVQVVLSAIGIYYFKAEALLFVICAMLINWIIRLFSGFSNIVKIMRR